MSALRQLTRGSYNTGWWGVPGPEWWRSTKTHGRRKGERGPMCGAKLSDEQRWQWCAGGLYVEWIDCERCQGVIRRLRRELSAEVANG